MASSHLLRIYGLLLLVLGASVLALLDPGAPEHAALSEVSGTVRALEGVTSKGGGISAVRLALSGDARHFHYLSKSGQIASVWRALEQAGSAQVTLWFDPADGHSPPLDSRQFFTVYQVQVGPTLVRSHAQVASDWADNNRIGVVLGYGCAAAGLVLLVVSVLRQS